MSRGINAFLPRWLVSLARRLATWSCPVEDLLAVGALEYWKAWRRYDPKAGASLMTYAYSAVRGRMLRERLASNLVRIPAYLVERASKPVWIDVALRPECQLSPHEPEDRTILRAEVASAIRSLPPEMQICVRSVLTDGESVAGTARRLGLSRHHCLSLISASVESLGRLLSGEAEVDAPVDVV